MVDVMDAHQAAKTWQREQVVTTFVAVPRDYKPSIKTIKVASINNTMGCVSRGPDTPKPGTKIPAGFDASLKVKPFKAGRPRISNGHPRPEPRPVEVKAGPTPREEVKPMATTPATDNLGLTVVETGTSKGGRAMAKLENRDDKFLVVVYAPEGQQVEAITRKLIA